MKPRCTEVYCIHVGHMGERITCIRGPPALPASVAHPALPASVARLQCLHPWPACITCIRGPACITCIRGQLAMPASVARLHYLHLSPACITCIRGPPALPASVARLHCLHPWPTDDAPCDVAQCEAKTVVRLPAPTCLFKHPQKPSVQSSYLFKTFWAHGAGTWPVLTPEPGLQGTEPEPHMTHHVSCTGSWRP